MNPIVDYSYYQSEYFGDKINQEEFTKYESKAQKKLASFTFNRIYSLDTFDNNIKDCICEIAEAIYTNDQLKTMQSSLISSESTDGHSVTYKESKKEKDLMMDLYQIARSCLPCDLLYVGVMKSC